MVLGQSIAEAWDDLYYLERACEVQCIALANGRQIIPVEAGLAASTAQQIREGDADSARQHLKSLHRILEQEEPHYKS